MNTIMLVTFSFIAGMMVMYMLAWRDMQEMKYACFSERDKRLSTEKALERIKQINKNSAR